jgi:hypothetical protein
MTYKVYQLSVTEARNSIYGSEEMVGLLYRCILSGFLNSQEGNLYRLLSLATQEGRLFSRSKFTAESREFLEELPCGFPLRLTVDTEKKSIPR